MLRTVRYHADLASDLRTAFKDERLARRPASDVIFEWRTDDITLLRELRLRA